jgi:LPS-assembly protein
VIFFDNFPAKKTSFPCSFVSFYGLCSSVPRIFLLVIVGVALQWLVVPSTAWAQTQIAGCKLSKTQNMSGTRLADEHYVMEGTADQPVQIDCDDLQFFADHMELFQKEGRVTAEGNVLYISGGNRIYAERMVYYTKTRTGTFYVAHGTAVLRQSADPGIFGTQEPDAFFWGEELQKIGPKVYRIVRGGFTTCVQPTPRWNLQSDVITLHLDDYAYLKNAIFRVKNVPLMYLPLFYYPIQEDNRATGFLMPIYSVTTRQGQTLSNQFFWAINRSQDATIEHDWFSKTGQQVGGEYRYVRAPGSQGRAQLSFLNEHQTTTTGSDGVVQTFPGTQSYSIVGDMAQRLPGHFQARANANYYTSIVTKQQYNQDLYQSTSISRRLGANLSGAWKAYSIGVTADRNDYFSSETSFTTTGSLPHITVLRSEHAIGKSPLYFGLAGDYATIVRSTTNNDVKVSDQGLTRMDVVPTLRVPFTKWQFLTVNSVVSWRGTYWTESLDDNNQQVDDPIGRHYFDLQTRVTGPVFNRIWTPNNGYAEKFKHVIEPSLTVHYVPDITNFTHIVKLDYVDQVLGTTQLTYAVNNRLYAKKTRSREIASVVLMQSYYTNENAATYDRTQSSAYGVSQPTHFGGVILSARGSPTDRIQADFRTEWDPTAHALKTFASNATASFGDWLQTTVTWSRRRFIENLPGYDNPAYASHFLGATANVHRMGNRVGGAYSFNYDLKQDTFLQQRLTAYYNSQCCGIAAEYQTFNYAGSFVSRGITQDHRFNLSFTLAGVGTFSNLFGAFGGQQGR